MSANCRQIFLSNMCWLSKPTSKVRVRTFISALESSPVHCLKPLPCGKRRWPGNGGEAAILTKINTTSVTCKARKIISPIIDICHYRSRGSRAMYEDKILTNPGDKVVLERAFDDLVKEIRAQQFVNIGTGKSGCERLYRNIITSGFRLQIIGYSQ
jgi:hypothetical protein